MALKDRITGNPVVSTVLAVLKRNKADAADQFAAAIGFFGFVSLIPIIIIAVAVAGALFADRVPEVVDAIQQSLPGMSTSEGLQSAIQGIVDNGGRIGLVGGVTLLVSGLRVTNAAQTATRVVFNLPLAEATGWKLRLWQLASLVILGTLALVGVGVTSAAASLTSSAFGEQFGVGAAVAGFLVGAALDIALFWVAYWLYTRGAARSWRDLLPGAILGGLGWTLLKSFGATYASSQAAGIEQQTGGGSAEASGGAAAVAVFASIVGLLLVFYIAGRLYVYGAELSATMMGLGPNEAPRPAEDALVVDPEAEATEDEEAGHASGTSDRDGSPEPDDTGSLAERFRARGALVDDSVVVPTADGTGTEVVPWHAPAGSRLDDREARQVAAFTASALAVLAAGWLGRK